MIKHALRGRHVVRLQCGDPFVFGRGGEEVLALGAGGIPVEVVPGLSTAIAAPALAGIPVTHRGLSSSFAVITGHHEHTYGPLLDAMPPFMGGGSMIGRVTLAETTWAPPPRRFEAGTPPIGPAIGMGAACNWMADLDWTAAHDHEMGLVQRVLDGLQKIDGTQILGPASLQNRYPVVSFMLDGVHPHDVAQTLDSFGVAVRAGHHCAQPMMDRFDLDGTTRVSIAPYNDNSDIDALLTGVRHAANTLR